MSSAPGFIDFENLGSLEIQGIDFDAMSKSFVVTAGKQGEFQTRISFEHAEEHEDPKSAQLVYLYNSAHSEADVRKLTGIGTTNTIGWLCTVGALTSNGHNFAENKYFRRAAFAAVSRLIHTGGHAQIHPASNGSIARLGDLFDESVSLVILHVPSIPPLSADCREILPHLHQYGFFPFSQASKRAARVNPICRDFFEKAGVTLKITECSRQTGASEFVHRVFKDLLPVASDDILRFFLYYQVVEALLERIFIHRQSQNILSMVTLRNDPIRLHPLIERLNHDASEKRKINFLFGNYTGIQGAALGLESACNDFLRAASTDEENGAAHSFYEVRNVIFHDFKRLNATANTHIGSIVSNLAWIVPELLLKFKVPEEENDYTI